MEYDKRWNTGPVKLWQNHLICCSTAKCSGSFSSSMDKRRYFAQAQKYFSNILCLGCPLDGQDWMQQTLKKMGQVLIRPSYLPSWLFKTLSRTLLPSVHGTFSSCFLLLAHQTFNCLGVYLCLIDCQLLLLILPIYARNIPIFSSRKLYSMLGDHVFCFRHRTFSILKSLKFKLNLNIKQLFQEECIFQHGLNDDRFHVLSQKAQCLFHPFP